MAKARKLAMISLMVGTGLSGSSVAMNRYNKTPTSGRKNVTKERIKGLEFVDKLKNKLDNTLASIPIVEEFNALAPEGQKAAIEELNNLGAFYKGLAGALNSRKFSNTTDILDQIENFTKSYSHSSSSVSTGG